MTKPKRTIIVVVTGGALVLLIGPVLVHFSHVKNEAQALCDGAMARFRPPLPHHTTTFTMRLHNHPTVGEWPGFGLGWVIDYRSPGAAAGVTYYVDLSGDVVHSEPLGWMREIERRTEELSAASDQRDGLNLELTNPLGAAAGSRSN